MPAPTHPHGHPDHIHEMAAFDRLLEIDPRFGDAIRITGYSANDILKTFTNLRMSDYSVERAVAVIFEKLQPAMDARRLDRRVRPVVG